MEHPWVGGKPLGEIKQPDKKNNTYRVRFKQIKERMNFLVSAHGTVEKARAAAMDWRKRISDEHGLTRNRYRRVDNPDGTYYYEVNVQLSPPISMKISPQDLPLAEESCWSVTSNGYARRGTWPRSGATMEMFHRLVMQSPLGMEVDHINRDRLDNRRENLRVVPYGVNQNNMKLNKKNTSGINGVRRNGTREGQGSWSAHWSNGKRRLASVSFSVKKYGEEGAKRRAIEARLAAVPDCRNGLPV